MMGLSLQLGMGVEEKILWALGIVGLIYLTMFILGLLGIGVFKSIFPIILFIPGPLIIILGVTLPFLYPSLFLKVMGTIALVCFSTASILAGLKLSGLWPGP